MTLLKRKRVFAAKVESTIGTPESLTASEGVFNAYGTIVQGNIPVEEREAQGSFNRLSGVSGPRTGTATLRTDLGWDGTTTMPTWASVLFPACGWAESSQVYTPRSEAPGTNVKTLTIGCYQDGRFKSIAGAVGNFRIVLPAGRMAYIEWTFTGVWQDPTDAAIIAPTYPTALPLKFNSATATFDSVNMKVESATIDSGNNVVMRECPTTAAGFISALITDRYPKITANPEAVLKSVQERYTQWIDAEEAALSLVVPGPDDATITIAAPKAQILNDQEADRNKIEVEQLEFGCNKNGTNNDQELSITFAEAS
jgi:hypothetical protein